MLNRRTAWRRPPIIQIIEWNGVDRDELAATVQAGGNSGYALSFRDSDGAAIFTDTGAMAGDFEILPGQHLALGDGLPAHVEGWMPEQYRPYPDEWLD